MKYLYVFFVTLSLFLLIGSAYSDDVEYEVRTIFLEPLEGRTYFPGNKLFVTLQVRDYHDRVNRIAFYMTPPKSKRPEEPFSVDESSSDGWAAVWEIPKDAEEGWYRISAQAFDKNGVKKGRESAVVIKLKKAETQLRITSPAKGKKFHGGQKISITGALVDREALTKRVDFYLYRASSEMPGTPTFSDTKLSGGCYASLTLPEKPLDEYLVVAKAYDSETGGNILSEDRISILIVKPEISLKIVEPRGGSYFYPGQEIHIYGEIRDPSKAAVKVLFYLNPSERKKSSKGHEAARQTGKPFAECRDLQAGFSAIYQVPYETEFGAQTILVEALGNDESEPPMASEDVSINIKKPEVRMKVLVPAKGACYYPGEDFYVNVEMEDRAGIVDRVGFVVYPLGEPMASTLTYFDKVFSDGCGTVFKIPDKIKAGKYVLEITAKDQGEKTLLQKTVDFEIKK